MTSTKTFAYRFIAVTETSHVAKRNSFSYRSYPHRSDAMSAVDKVNAKGSFFKRAYVVDQQNSPNVILP